MEIKVAKLGEAVRTVTIEGETSTVQAALQAAGYELKVNDTLMVNGQEANPNTEVRQDGIVTLVPKIKGGLI